MKLKELYLKNFLSFGESSFMFPDKSVSLIVGDNGTGGSNGAGKSSIFDAITWALFGETIRRVGKDDVVRRDETEAKVSLQMESAPGQSLGIIRTRNIPQQTTKLILLVNGQDKSRNTVKETQAYLDSFLGLDFDIYRNSILFAQNDISEFIEGTSKYRTDLLGKIFKFELLDKCEVILKDESTALESVIITKQTKQSLLLSNIEALPAWKIKHEDAGAYLAKCVVVRNELKLGLETYQTTMQFLVETKLKRDGINNRISDLERSIQNRSQQLHETSRITKETLTAEISSLAQRIQIMTQQLGGYDTTKTYISTCETSLKSLNPEQTLEDLNKVFLKIHDLDTKIKTIRESKQVFGKIEGMDKCPTCRAPLSPQTTEQVLKDYDSQIAGLSVEIDRLTPEYHRLEAIKGQIGGLKEGISSATKSLIGFDVSPTQIEELKQQKSLREDRLTTLTTIDTSTDTEIKAWSLTILELKQELVSFRLDENEFNRLLSEIRVCQGNILASEKTIEGAIALVAECKTNIGNLERASLELGALNTELIAFQENLNILSLSRNIFHRNGIKTYLIDNMLPLLEDKINAYLSSLSNGKITVSLQTQVENKKNEKLDRFEIFIHHNGQTLTYDSYSGGERRRLAMAMRLALADLIRVHLGVKLSFALLDETSDSLDDQGCADLVDLLNILKEKYDNILVISHDESMKSRFDDIISVKKKDGVSYIEVEK